MGTAIGDVLPLAIGVAISPIPIIATILMLLTPRAGQTATAFLAGWILGIAVGYVVFVAIGSAIDLSSNSDGNAVTATIRLVLGVLLLALAVKQWRTRPAPGEEPSMPAWLAAIDKVTPGKALALGVGLSAINPKNLLMIVGAAVAVSQLDVGVGAKTVTGVVFTILAASTVAVRGRRLLHDARAGDVVAAGPEGVAHRQQRRGDGGAPALIGVSLIGKGIGGY
ncbi:GAP family protein [Rhodococcus hoagii]|nr:GAP family protein [Prescottella equi]